MDWSEGLPLMAWAMAHVAGIAIAFLTRLPFGHRAQAMLRCALTCGLVAVGAIALLSNMSASIGWVGSGATLGTMVVAAVWEPIQGGHDPMLTRLIAGHDIA